MLKERIENDLKQALKERNQTAVSTLRMLNAAILNAEIAEMRKEFKDEDIIAVTRQEVKKHKDSIEEYGKGKRDDLVKKEEQELEILMKYLPAELGEEEIKKIVKSKVDELGATGPADFPKVMGAVMKLVAGRAGGDAVSRIVKEMLEK